MIKDEIRKIVNENFKEDDVKNRGRFQLLCKKIREEVSSKYIKSPYHVKDLENICEIAEEVILLCSEYEIIPTQYLISIATGLTSFTLSSVINNRDYDGIKTLNDEYEQDWRRYIEENLKNYKSTLSLSGNTLHGYPLYCVLQEIREAEKDWRIERGRLGDITQLNAPQELGGFGYAKPSVQITNQKLVIEDKEKLLSKYLDKKPIEVVSDVEDVKEVDGKDSK